MQWVYFQHPVCRGFQNTQSTYIKLFMRLVRNLTFAWDLHFKSKVLVNSQIITTIEIIK